jgi:TolA-binding protein
VGNVLASRAHGAILVLEGLAIAFVFALIASWLVGEVMPRPAEQPTEAGSVAIAALRRAEIWALIGAAVATALALTADERGDVGRRALGGLAIGALAGAAGALVSRLPELGDRVAPDWVESAALAVTGALLGGLLGSRRPHGGIALGGALGAAAGLVAVALVSDADSSGEVATRAALVVGVVVGGLVLRAETAGARDDAARARPSDAGPSAPAPGVEPPEHGGAEADRSAEEWYRMGDDALKAKPPDLATASRAYSRAVEADPRHANALYRLGEIAQAQHRAEEARRLFERALQANPRHASARDRLSRLGSAPSPPKPPPEAGRSSDEWYRIGDDALKAKPPEIARATQAYRRALEADPSHANALYRLGEIAQAQHRPREAMGLFERALQANPQHAGARDRLRRLQSAPSPPKPSPGPPHPPAGDGPVGIVAALQRSQETQWLTRTTLSVWTFRVQTDGDVLPVRLRGESLSGSVREGEWVELPANYRRGRPVKSLMNLTTLERVTVKTRPWYVTAMVVFIVLFVAAWIIALFVKVGGELFF